MHATVLSSLGVAAFAGLLVMVVAARLRVPAIVLLLAVGASLGADGLGVVQPRALGPGLKILVEMAIAVILFEGALSLRPGEYRAHSGPIRNLLTVGALVTFVGATTIAHHVLGLPVGHAAVVGAILIVTGPTVVTPLLRHIRPKQSLAEILRWEGILIDPIGALFAVVVLEAVIAGERGSLQTVALSYAASFAAGGAAGVGAGLLLDWLLRRPNWVEEDLRSPLALAMAFAAFAGAEAVVRDSGLFAAVAAGMVVAARHPPGMEEIERFKGGLTSFLLAILFILLSAAVDLDAIAALGWRGPAFLLALVGVRALSVAISTVGTSLGVADKAFLAWLAPRGVVAAAVASLFAERLAEAGHTGTEVVRGAVFFVIVGTVVVQGATARLLARRLGLLAPEPTEIVIIGADRFGRALALELAAARIPVTLVDKNPAKLAEVEAEGLRVLAADAHDDTETAAIDRTSIACVIAATPNDEANALICAAFAGDLGRARVTQLPTDALALARGERHAATRWPFAFGDRLTYGLIDSVLEDGGRLRAIAIERQETAEALRRRIGSDFRPLVEVRKDRRVTLIRRRNSTLRPGTLAIGLESRLPAGVETPLTREPQLAGPPDVVPGEIHDSQDLVQDLPVPASESAGPDGGS